MPPISILIKPASSKCNLKCTYCFYHSIAENRHVHDYGFMSMKTIEVIIKRVLEFASGYATFSFQGGEPTLCGLDFFEAVVELQKKYNKNHAAVNNCIQTNGSLIDEKWATFLQKNNFLVGLSLDGPCDLHDRYRVDAKGSKTFYKTLKTAELFNRYQVEYNILFVVTNEHAQSPERLYNFFKAKNFKYLQMIPCIDPAGNKRGTHPYSLQPKNYTYFLKHFFDKWYQDFINGREISIRYFDNLVRMVMGMAPETCGLLGFCQCQFVFEADGSVYPCDFYVTDEWKLGSICDKDLPELYKSDNCTRFIKTSHHYSVNM